MGRRIRGGCERSARWEEEKVKGKEEGEGIGMGRRRRGGSEISARWEEEKVEGKEGEKRGKGWGER